MKKSLFVLMALGAAQCVLAQGGKFSVNGKIANADGQRVVLSYGSRTAPKADTTTVKDGKFAFTGELDNPYYRGMLIVGEYDPYGRKENNMTELAVEPVEISIDAPTGKLEDADIKGGKTQAELNAYNVEAGPLMKQLQALNKEYYAAEAAARDEIRKKIEPLGEQYTKIQKAFWETHPDSYLSPQFFLPSMGHLSYAEIKQVYDSFSDNVKKYSPDAQEIKKELSALENVQPGAVAPDFTANDINGKPFTLSSLRGKVVIIDFWASWCVPCRKSNPHMRELYQKYHDRGLDFVYVSDDDSKPDAWRKAVEQDELTGEGFHHVLRGLKQIDGPARYDHSNDISDKYAIHFLPTKYLIDREGKIVCKIEDNEKLEEALENLLK